MPAPAEAIAYAGAYSETVRYAGSEYGSSSVCLISYKSWPNPTKTVVFFLKI